MKNYTVQLTEHEAKLLGRMLYNELDEQELAGDPQDDYGPMVRIAAKLQQAMGTKHPMVRKPRYRNTGGWWMEVLLYSGYCATCREYTRNDKTRCPGCLNQFLVMNEAWEDDEDYPIPA